MIAIWTFCILSLNSVALAASVPYVDVPPNHWALNAVTMLANSGYSIGYADNTFRGDRYITRYEFAGMMAQLFKQKTGTSITGHINPFNDLPSNHYFYKYVTTLAANGIIGGYGDGTFRGDKALTRYEMAINLARLLAKSNVSVGSHINGNPFSDVPNNHFAYDSLIYLASLGITDTYGDGTFRGDRSATRYEAAVLIYKAAVLN